MEIAENIRDKISSEDSENAKRITTVTSWTQKTLVFIRFKDDSVLVKVYSRDFQELVSMPLSAGQAEQLRSV